MKIRELENVFAEEDAGPQVRLGKQEILRRILVDIVSSEREISIIASAFAGLLKLGARHGWRVDDIDEFCDKRAADRNIGFLGNLLRHDLLHHSSPD